MAGFVEQDTTNQLHNITAPTVILWGDQDLYFPRGDQETLRRSVPRATLLIYEETGHALHWKQSERFVADLAHFLQQQK